MDHDNATLTNDYAAAIPAKIMALFVLGGISTLIGLLTYFCLPKIREKIRGGRAEKFLESVLSFGGGVLLATIFLHLMPEFLEKFTSIENSIFRANPTSYAMILIFAGFFLIYLFDKLVHVYTENLARRDTK